jgi:hypothetical protein
MKKASRQSKRTAVTADQRADSQRLDGNAAAGLLSEIFAQDMTAGLAKCAGCGTTRAVGALHVYSHGMGMVVRCPGCDGVVLRISRTPTRYWLDARGAVSIAISAVS